MSSFSRGALAFLLSLLCCSALGAQVRIPAAPDTVRVQRPLPNLTRPPVQLPDSVVVPEVIGQSVMTAVRRLTAAGLRPVTVDSLLVSRPTPGLVVSQSPKAGSRVARGAPGVVSVGVPAPAPPPAELVPALVGMTMPEAQRTIVERKLRLVVVDSILRAGGGGRVTSQRPAAGSPMPRDRALSLSVTVPPSTFAMPDLGGQPLPRARAIVAARGLVLALVDSVRREGGDRTVVEQKPAAGEPVRQGERVALVLSFPAPDEPVAPPVVATAPPPAPASPALTPAVQPPSQAPAPQPTAAPAGPAEPGGPVAPTPAAARTDTVPVPAEPAGSPLPWILLGLLIGALVTAAALAGRQRLETRRERTALRLALQAGPPTVRIAPRRHPDTQELRLPGPLFAGPAVRIRPHLDPGEIRLVMHPSPTTRE